MKVEKLKSDDITSILSSMEQYLVSSPTFMLYCKCKEKRAEFVRLYFKCYLSYWQKHSLLFVNKKRTALVVLTDKEEWGKMPSGLPAIPFLMSDGSKYVRLHHDVVEGITGIVVPETLGAYHIQIFGDIENNLTELFSLIKEAELVAEKEKKAIIYETFSKKLIKIMELKGYGIAYQRYFLDSQFIQTLMTKEY